MQEMLWGIWFGGLVVVVITRILINRYCDEYDDGGVIYHIINVLCCLCIFVVGGIANGKFIGMILSDMPEDSIILNIIFTILLELIPAFLTFVVGFAILGLYKLEDNIPMFVIAFIISIIIWAIPCTIYNSNIEVTEQTVIVQKQERELISFCNMPVQNVSGDIKGNSIIGTGSVSGQIHTSYEIPYWYMNENNVGLYDCVSAKNSRIVYINEDEVSRVEIITYANQRISHDKNIDKEIVSTLSEYTEYYFYIPSYIMQYSVK